MVQKKIGVFDSGIGGLTVLKELVRVLPYEDYLYYADSIHVPYGEKTKAQIQELCIGIVKFLLHNDCKMIVIACNTATIAALDLLQLQFDCPIMGMITSGVELAINLTNNQKICVLGTKFTIDSHVFYDEFKKRNAHLDISEVACNELAFMIEKGWNSFANRQEVLARYVEQIPCNSDTILLACTHYPLIEYDFKALLPNQIIINPALAMALDVKNILIKNHLQSPKQTQGSIVFCANTDAATIFKNIL